MVGVLKISEAASIALHTVALLASNPSRPVSAREAASELHVSEAHLSKVLQRLGKVGLVKSLRGPGGGFMLARPPEDIVLLEVYEAIDGPLVPHDCLFDEKTCHGRTCVLGGLLDSVSEQVRNHLSNTRLTDLNSLYVMQDA